MPSDTAQPLSPSVHPGGHETLVERPTSVIPAPGPGPEPSYYGIPILKRPVWAPEIAYYFFLGGLSGGSYMLARVAERLGGQRFRPLTRASTAVATAALLPCPALLIIDLGDPKRFHHMLRVFKPRSPMSLGSWVLTAYSGAVFLMAAREWFGHPRNRLARLAFAVVDAAGLPLALLFSGYTGVLLSATSTPVWCRNPWLGPLFTSSGISNAVSALSLVLELRRDPSVAASRTALEKIEPVAHLAEAAAFTGYLASAGNLARPLTEGKWAPWFWGAAAGVAAGEVLRHLPSRKPARRVSRLAAALLGVASGFALKWAMHHAGKDSASDPSEDRQIGRPGETNGRR
jgi:formate-dependent nitrite reductase membrane component NrfD